MVSNYNHRIYLCIYRSSCNNLPFFSSCLFLLFMFIFVDSVYHEDLYQPLIDSMIACSTPDSIILLGLTRDFMKPSFFDRLRVYFDYSMIPHRSIRNDDEHSNIGIFVCKLLRPPLIVRRVQYID